MTERDFGQNNWIAQVVNLKDPDQSGRVQIRIIGRHDDTENIKDEDLHWAIPHQPITSAAFGKIGQTPLGLVKGSKVYGHWFDSDQQLPIITGSLGKAGDPKSGGDTTDGIPEIDIKTGSIPGAAQNYSDPTPNYPFSNLYGSKIDINQINNGDGYKTIATYTPATGVDNKFAVDTKLKEPKKPTTASADKADSSDVLDIVKQVDPDQKSRVLPGAVDGFSQVQKIMSMTSPNGLSKLLSGGIQGAIGGLAKNFGLNNILGPLSGVLNSGQLPPLVQNALRSALSSVMKSATASGGSYNHSAVSTHVPTINPVIGSPSANLIVATAAATFVQQYFALNAEPYPGYIQWKDPTTNNIVYTLRGNEPHYPTAQAHVQGNSAAQLISTMGPIISNLSGGALSTGDISKISSLLTGHVGGLSADALTKVLGKGANLQSIIGLASKLIPNLSKGINGLISGHLPQSVLDPGKIGAAMNDFTKNQSLLALKKQEMKKTVDAEPAAQQDAQIKAYNDAQAAANEPGFSGNSGQILADATAPAVQGPTATEAGFAAGSSPLAGYI
jgi:hypothetical protein